MKILTSLLISSLMKILTASLSDCVTTIEVTSSDSHKSDPSKKDPQSTSTR